MYMTLTLIYGPFPAQLFTGIWPCVLLMVAVWTCLPLKRSTAERPHAGMDGRPLVLIHKLFSPLLQTGGRETPPRPEVGSLLGANINPPAPQVSVIRRGAHEK